MMSRAAARALQLPNGRVEDAVAAARTARCCPAAGCGPSILSVASPRGRCAQVLAGLADGGASVSLRAAAAAHPACPPPARAALRSDVDLLVRWAPPARDATVQMATDECPEVRAAAAAHPACPAAVLRCLADDPHAMVKDAAAVNPAAPPPVLAALTGGASFWTKLKVAANPSTPQRCLEHLARTIAGGVLAEIASNPSASPWLLGAIALGDCLCRGECRSGGACRWVDESREMVLVAVLANPATPKTVIDELAAGCGDDDVEYQRAVARSDTTGAELQRLAYHTNRAVRDAAASNPRIAEKTLRLLASERVDNLRVQELSRNPSCPPDVIETLLNDSMTGSGERRSLAAHPLCPPETVARLAQAQQPGVRGGALSNPVCDSRVLAVVALDPDSDPVDRVAAAANANIPAEVLKRLLVCSHPAVRDEARGGLAARALRTAS